MSLEATETPSTGKDTIVPYVLPEDRTMVEVELIGLLRELQDAPIGTINYAITRILDTWVQTYGLNYERINAAIGVLECAKLELYRRVAVPYENHKCQLNGDVYWQAAPPTVGRD